MPKPLRSEIQNPPDLQFSHFGVLDAGNQNKGAFFGSIVFNVILAIIAVIIGASVKKINDTKKLEALTYVVPLKTPPPEPPKPKLPPPPKLPPVPPPPEPPKIKLPDVKPVEIPKPVAVVQPKPLPIVTPMQPKVVAAVAAPKVMAVNLPAKAAAVPNNDPHPTAVRMGQANNPIKNDAGPAVSSINLGRSGQPGMSASNTGFGAPTKVSLPGNGSPGGSQTGTGPVAVAGIPHGGGFGQRPGNGTGNQPAQVSLGQAPPPPPAAVSTATKVPTRTVPQLIYKPEPTYTAEAKAAHIEGKVMVKIKVAANGAVTVLGVEKGLGHGLDQAALQSAQGCRFKPAVDANGNPTDWEGVVSITFQIA